MENFTDVPEVSEMRVRTGDQKVRIKNLMRMLFDSQCLQLSLITKITIHTSYLNLRPGIAESTALFTKRSTSKTPLTF